MNLPDFLALLDGVKYTGQNKFKQPQYMAICPAHDDKKPSLAVSQSAKKDILTKCLCGCSTESVVFAMGLKMSDLKADESAPRATAHKARSGTRSEKTTPPAERNHAKPATMQSAEKRSSYIKWYAKKNNLPIESVHSYCYGSFADGLTKLKIRYENDDKDFRWMMDNPAKKSGFAMTRGDCPHRLYAPGTIESPLFIVEGEKDADNMTCLGYHAVSGEDGADIKGNKWRDEYTAQLAGIDYIYIIPDNDDKGLPFMQAVAGKLYAAGFRNVYVLDLRSAWPDMPEKADISDYLDTFGAEQTAATITDLCSNAIAWEPASQSEPGLITAQATIDTKDADGGSVDGEVISLDLDHNGKPRRTVDNFFRILASDAYYKDMRFNLLANRPEWNGHSWTDSDESESKRYIEAAHGIFSKEKHFDALRLLWKTREYHPIQDLVSVQKWDGVERCKSFLATWAKCDDTPYTQEVSRLIFAGGINRLYQPGCKFDDVPVLVGAQGSGKSTIVRWLALNDKYYAEATTVSGQRSIEQLSGAWIVEFAELSAIKSDKNVEEVKAYIVRQNDKYRLPYDRSTSELPRRCVFIGTTNSAQFLTDKTGGRRFYPVTVHSSGYDLHEHESECRDYIIQCWAEARFKYDQDARHTGMEPYANPELITEYRAAQAEAQEDDWRVGAIEKYLYNQPNGAYVCAWQLYQEALFPGSEREMRPTNKESREIGSIMQQFPDWERCNKTIRLHEYGPQKCWQRVSGSDQLGYTPDGDSSNNLPF